MYLRSPQISKDFKAYKNGDIDGLASILKTEQARVFDYVMRMIGQLARASDVTEEALSSIEQSADESDTAEELLVMIYKTARNFAADVWNADTSRLENSAYQNAQGKDNQILAQLEVLVRNLPPIQREVLLLRERYGFALDEVAEITTQPVTEIEMVFAQALGAIEQNSTLVSQRLPDLLCRLALFDRPKFEGPATQNLSLIMNDFKKTNRMASTSFGRIRVIFYLVIITISWIFREQIVEYTETHLVPLFNSLFGASSNQNQ